MARGKQGNNEKGDSKMAAQTLPPELERRIKELEQPENQGAGFSGLDWALLALTGLSARRFC